jgi:uncharacterized protein
MYCKLSETDMFEPYVEAISTGDIDTVKSYMLLGTDVNLPVAAEGNRPVHIAAVCGQVEVIRTLVRLGADVNILDELGHRPISSAAHAGHVGAIRALASWGAM